MSDPNKKFYFKEVEEDEIKETFKIIDEAKPYVELKEKVDSPSAITDNFKLKYVDLANEKTYLKFDDKLLKKIMGSKLVEKEVLFKCGVDKFYYFSAGKLTFNKPNNMYVYQRDSLLYKCQQRSNYRLEASRFAKIKISIDLIDYEGLDISAGGVSFLCPSSEKSTFEVGKAFNSVEILLNKNFYTIAIAEVVSEERQEIKEKGREDIVLYKVALQFKQISKNTEEELFIQINKESRLEEVRRKFLNKKTLDQ